MGKSVLNSVTKKNRPSLISSSYGLDERGSIPGGDQAASGAHVAACPVCTGILKRIKLTVDHLIPDIKNAWKYKPTLDMSSWCRPELSTVTVSLLLFTIAVLEVYCLLKMHRIWFSTFDLRDDNVISVFIWKLFE